jgi:hypothetical protein
VRTRLFGTKREASGYKNNRLARAYRFSSPEGFSYI